MFGFKRRHVVLPFNTVLTERVSSSANFECINFGNSSMVCIARRRGILTGISISEPDGRQQLMVRRINPLVMNGAQHCKDRALSGKAIDLVPCQFGQNVLPESRHQG